MTDLLDETIAMINASAHSLSRIAHEGQVSLRWLQMLRKGQIPDPGVRKIQRIHDFLLAGPTRTNPRKPGIYPRAVLTPPGGAGSFFWPIREMKVSETFSQLPSGVRHATA